MFIRISILIDNEVQIEEKKKGNKKNCSVQANIF